VGSLASLAVPEFPLRKSAILDRSVPLEFAEVVERLERYVALEIVALPLEAALLDAVEEFAKHAEK